jgi:hypothetical protein
MATRSLLSRPRWQDNQGTQTDWGHCPVHRAEGGGRVRRLSLVVHRCSSRHEPRRSAEAGRSGRPPSANPGRSGRGRRRSLDVRHRSSRPGRLRSAEPGRPPSNRNVWAERGRKTHTHENGDDSTGDGTLTKKEEERYGQHDGDAEWGEEEVGDEGAQDRRETELQLRTARWTRGVHRTRDQGGWKRDKDDNMQLAEKISGMEIRSKKVWEDIMATADGSEPEDRKTNKRRRRDRKGELKSLDKSELREIMRKQHEKDDDTDRFMVGHLPDRQGHIMAKGNPEPGRETGTQISHPRQGKITRADHRRKPERKGGGRTRIHRGGGEQGRPKTSGMGHTHTHIHTQTQTSILVR